MGLTRIAAISTGGDAADLAFVTETLGAPSEKFRITGGGNVGIGTASPTAVLHLKAGTTGLAPLKFSAGTNLTTPEAGAMEFSGTTLSLTQSDGTRKTLAFTDSAITGTADNSKSCSGDALCEASNILVNTSGGVIRTQGDANWFGRRNTVVGGGTIGTYLSNAAAFTHTGSTISATKDFDGTFPAAALAIYNQFNGSFETQFRFLRKAAGSTTTDGALDTLMIIDNAGNVGIGTASPAVMLHLSTGAAQNDANGTLQIQQTTNTTGSGSNASLIAKNVNGTSQFMQWENKGLRIGTRSVSAGAGDVSITSGVDAVAMTIKEGGNVGIGTTGPGALLHVSKSQDNANTELKISNPSNTGSQASLTLGVAASDDLSTSLTMVRATNTFIISNSGDPSSRISFETRKGDGTTAERLRIDENGNTSLNTDAKLNMEGGSGDTYMVYVAAESRTKLYTNGKFVAWAKD